jgi:rod shape-determining protein MreC
MGMKQGRRKLLFVLLVCLSVFFISSTYLFFPTIDFFFYSVFTKPISFLKTLPDFFQDLENNRLKQKIARLEAQIVSLEEIKQENQRLRDLLSLRNNLPYTITIARVVSKEPSLWHSTFIIDKGLEQGILRKMPVISAEGLLVGIISEVGDNNSRVMLLQDPNYRVHSMVQRSRVTGVFEGRMNREGMLKYVPFDSDVQEGDVIITSGMGRIYPKGLPVGTVKRVSQPGTGMFLDIRIDITADLTRIEEVAVIR